MWDFTSWGKRSLNSNTYDTIKKIKIQENTNTSQTNHEKKLKPIITFRQKKIGV